MFFQQKVSSKFQLESFLLFFTSVCSNHTQYIIIIKLYEYYCSTEHFVKDLAFLESQTLFCVNTILCTYLIVLWTISRTLGGQCNNLSLSCCKTTIATYPTSPTFGIGSENVPPILGVCLFVFWMANLL